MVLTGTAVVEIRTSEAAGAPQADRSAAVVRAHSAAKPHACTGNCKHLRLGQGDGGTVPFCGYPPLANVSCPTIRIAGSRPGHDVLVNANPEDGHIQVRLTCDWTARCVERLDSESHR